MLVDELKDLIGEDAANDFLFAFGGMRIWIPSPKPCPKSEIWRSRIIKTAGEDAALTLFVTYGGDYLYVPNGKQSRPLDARRKVAEMQRQGMTINEMAEAVGRSRRTIFRWLNLPHSKVMEKK